MRSRYTYEVLFSSWAEELRLSWEADRDRPLLGIRVVLGTEEDLITPDDDDWNKIESSTSSSEIFGSGLIDNLFWWRSEPISKGSILIFYILTISGQMVHISRWHWSCTRCMAYPKLLSSSILVNITHIKIMCAKRVRNVLWTCLEYTYTWIALTSRNLFP